jgi:signal transduction histidine kinase
VDVAGGLGTLRRAARRLLGAAGRGLGTPAALPAIRRAAARLAPARPRGMSRRPEEFAGLRPSDRWPFWPGWIDVAWVIFSLANLLSILIFSRWETIPFHFIWISFTLLYGFRVWGTKPTLWVLAIVMVTTFLAIGLDVLRGTEPADELNEVPLMAAMFWAMVWHARRRMTAEAERYRVDGENTRLLAAQREFIQDAAHQLRTPITIALGHAELLARELTGRQDQRDIHVVVGELTRLRSLSERLLLIAASENPEFLRLEPVAVDQLAIDALARWQPAAPRRWQLGHLDPVSVRADPERLRLALDALLENAVQHTEPSDIIRLAVLCDASADVARLSVEDSGTGIPAAELARIFDRFRTGSSATGRRGTGLGLALVSAIARGHGGEVRARSTPGEGATFEIVLPARSRAAGPTGLAPAPAAALAVPGASIAGGVQQAARGSSGGRSQ